MAFVLKRALLASAAMGGDRAPTEYDFSLAASDSFNRADGVLGNTDGAGVDGITGGSGKAWTSQVGTATITSNRLRFSAVVANVGIATVDTGKVDGVVCAKVKTGSAGGVVVRYVDASNYIRAYVTAANQVVLQQILAGVTTNLISTTTTYVEDAELVVRLDGLRIGVEYNGTYYGAGAINAAFAASTLHGVFANAASSSYNFDAWHFVNLPGYYSDTRPSLVQVLAGEYLITTPMRGDTTRCVEYDLRQEKVQLVGYAFTSNVRHLYGMNLVTLATAAKTQLSIGVGWESAGQIGADADVVGDYGYFGSTHQSEQLQTFTVTVSRVTTISRWKRVYSESVSVAQTINTIYPKDATTVVGTTSMRHLFAGSGLYVYRTHTYTAGYKLYGWYGAMLPVLAGAALDTYQVGTNAPALFVGDDGAKNLGTQTDTYKAWLAAGDYAVCMHLPSGGPAVPSDWSKSGDYKGWLRDNASGEPKFYVNYVSGTFAEAVAAVESVHTCEYYVELR